MIYSNILKKIRKEKRLTQKELAKKTGIHPSTISHIEKGVRAGSVTTLLKICQALDIDLADFIVFPDTGQTGKYLHMVDKIIKEYPDFLCVLEAAERAVKDKNIKILLREFKNFEDKHKLNSKEN